VLGFEPMTYGSESECATHYSFTAFTEQHVGKVLFRRLTTSSVEVSGRSLETKISIRLRLTYSWIMVMEITVTYIITSGQGQFL